MSLDALAWAIKQKAGNSPAKLTLLALADCADNKGRCYPSYKHIAELTELSHSGVRKAVRRLRDLGLLVIEETHRRNGSQTSNTYTLAMGGCHDRTGGCSTVTPLIQSENLSTEPKGSEPAAPADGDKSPEGQLPQTLDASIWDLYEQCGGKRSMLGKLIKQYSQRAVAAAVGEVVTMRPADPNSMIVAILKKNPHTGQSPDWARVPKDNDALEPWARTHGFHPPHQYQHPTYQAYRDSLWEAVRARQAEEQAA